jgi:hypothetical protein
VIQGGCGASASIGLELVGSSARVQNNLVLGGGCPLEMGAPPTTVGIRVVATPGPAEPDIHSNTVLTIGANTPCGGGALVFDLTEVGSGTTRRGLVRNNILDGGACQRARAVKEERAGAGPRLLLNNDLWRPTAAPVALYATGDGGDLRSLPEITRIPGLEARDNISVTPLFGAAAAGADVALRNAGTAEGAPTHDILGRPRPADGGYDIGAHELPAPKAP